MPEWLAKLLGRFDSLESKVDKLSPAATVIDASQLTAVSELLEKANAALTERDASLVSLKAELEKAQMESKEATAALKAANDKAASAEKTAQEILATQGLTPAELPEGGEPKSETSAQQLDALRKKLSEATDPKEKFKLSHQIRELLSKKN